MKNIENALTLLAGHGATGRDFYSLAAQALSAGLGCRWAAIVRHDAANDQADLLAFSSDGAPMETFSYPLKETPCEDVYGAAAQSLPQLFVADDIVQHFPGDNMLRDMGAKSYRGELFFNAQGAPGGHVFVMDDKAMLDSAEDRAFFRLVTQRVGAEFNRWRTELALKESQARLQHAAKLATLGYWVWDEVADRASYCSDELARIFGYGSGKEYCESLTSTESDIANIHPEDQARYRGTLKTALAENRGFEYEYRILNRDGDIRHVREITEPVFDEQGRLLRSNGVIQDITDTKIKGQELESANKRKDEVLGEFNAVLDSIEYGILFMDADLKIRLHNRAYREIWGLPESFFEGNPSFREDMAITRCTSLCDVEEDTWEAFLDAREAEILSAAPASTEVGLTDGRTLQSQCIALPDGGRMLTYFDITELKEREEALRVAMEHAKVANLAKSQFLANMSHELRTPLNAILGYGELISDGIYGDVPERLQQVMDRMERNGRHLLGLINNVLDLSRIEAGQLGLHLDDYSMQDVIDTVIATSRPQAAAKGLELGIEVEGTLPIGYGDSQRIAQVLRNLIDNAIKFTDQGEILLRASSTENIFLVSVTDQGPGIPVDDQEVIFDSFRQADGTSTRKSGGSGLGLAIARRMIELHGGRIWVKSTPGEGAAFSFTLPAKVREPQAEAADESLAGE